MNSARDMSNRLYDLIVSIAALIFLLPLTSAVFCLGFDDRNLWTRSPG